MSTTKRSIAIKNATAMTTHVEPMTSLRVDQLTFFIGGDEELAGAPGGIDKAVDEHGTEEDDDGGDAPLEVDALEADLDAREDVPEVGDARADEDAGGDGGHHPCPVSLARFVDADAHLRGTPCGAGVVRVGLVRVRWCG